MLRANQKFIFIKVYEIKMGYPIAMKVIKCLFLMTAIETRTTCVLPVNTKCVLHTCYLFILFSPCVAINVPLVLNQILSAKEAPTQDVPSDKYTH